jgi:hypothetical protein
VHATSLIGRELRFCPTRFSIKSNGTKPRILEHQRHP